MQVDLADWRLLINQRAFSVVGPVVRCGNNNAVFERLLSGCREEAVDIAFLDAVVFLVELALDRVEFAGASGTGDEVDSCVGSADAEFTADVGQHPDVAVEGGIRGFVFQVGPDEFFKVGAFFVFCDSC